MLCQTQQDFATKNPFVNQNFIVAKFSNMKERRSKKKKKTFTTNSRNTISVLDIKILSLLKHSEFQHHHFVVLYMRCTHLMLMLNV